MQQATNILLIVHWQGRQVLQSALMLARIPSVLPALCSAAHPGRHTRVQRGLEAASVQHVSSAVLVQAIMNGRVNRRRHRDFDAS